MSQNRTAEAKKNIGCSQNRTAEPKKNIRCLWVVVPASHSTADGVCVISGGGWEGRWKKGRGCEHSLPTR
eukprot:scaffold4120_cov101-Isochrysis_galbana.AAC.1